MEISKNYKNVGGFTLPELMIIVAVIGLLVGVAMPAYSDYTTRARMTDALTKASVCRTPISFAMQTFKAIPQTVPTAANGIDFGCECGVWNNYGAGNNCSKYVSSIFVNQNGVIQIQLRETISNEIENGDRIRIIPRNAAGQGMSRTRVLGGSTIHTWECGVHPNANYTFAERLLPSSCRA